MHTPGWKTRLLILLAIRIFGNATTSMVTEVTEEETLMSPVDHLLPTYSQEIDTLCPAKTAQKESSPYLPNSPS